MPSCEITPGILSLSSNKTLPLLPPGGLNFSRRRHYSRQLGGFQHLPLAVPHQIKWIITSAAATGGCAPVFWQELLLNWRKDIKTISGSGEEISTETFSRCQNCWRRVKQMLVYFLLMGPLINRLISSSNRTRSKSDCGREPPRLRV